MSAAEVVGLMMKTMAVPALAALPDTGIARPLVACISKINNPTRLSV
jgi:hypothetical protein